MMKKLAMALLVAFVGVGIFGVYICSNEVCYTLTDDKNVQYDICFYEFTWPK